MIDFYNPKNWKKTHAKSFDAWICMPPLNTKIFNAAYGIEQRTDEVNKYVLCYPNGFQSVVDLAYIERTFVEPYDCYSITAERLEEKKTGRYIPWFKAWSGAHMKGELLALHLPCNKKEHINVEVGNFIANAEGINHGDGDYIVCPVINGSTPDLRNPYVINGLLFPHLFALNNIHLSLRMKRYLKTSKLTKPSEPFGPLYDEDFVREVTDILLRNGIKIKEIKTNFERKIYNSPLETYWWTIIFADKNFVLKIRSNTAGIQSGFECLNNKGLSFLLNTKNAEELATPIIKRIKA